MNRFKCPACGGDQYTSRDKAENCIYCGNKELQKMDTLEPKESDKECHKGAAQKTLQEAQT
jgi:DNA-directed RNA polymerase subunit RPC12/RpoP